MEHRLVDGPILFLLAQTMYLDWARVNGTQRRFDTISWEGRRQWLLQAKALYDSHFTSDGLFRLTPPGVEDEDPEQANRPRT